MKAILISFFFYCANIHAYEYSNKKLPNLTLKEDLGGRLDGSSWDLKSSLENRKVTVIYYVDPDEKDTNEELSEAFLERNFSDQKVQFIAIINMDATWLPNFAIAASLKKKQEKYPDTLYLKDFVKAGVKTWKIADDQNDIIVLNPEGKVIFSKFGKVLPKERENLFKQIEELIK